MEALIRDDFEHTDRLSALMLTEPESNKEDLDLLAERKARAVELLNTTPWTADMHRILVSAGFFHEVDRLNMWQQSKVTHALRCLQECTRDQLSSLATDDAIMGDGMRLYPVSRRFRIRFSWPDRDVIKVHAIVAARDAGLLGYLEF